MILTRVVRTFCFLSLAVLSTSVELVAQTASYTFFGKGCRDPFGKETLLFINRGVPRIGSKFRVVTDSTRLGVNAFLLTGLSRTRYGSIRLPFDLQKAGVDNACGLLRVSAEIMTRSHVTVEIPIPNDRSLLGASFYQQVLKHVYVGRGSVVLSRGGHGIIGT